MIGPSAAVQHVVDSVAGTVRALQPGAVIAAAPVFGPLVSAAQAVE